MILGTSFCIIAKSGTLVVNTEGLRKPIVNVANRIASLVVGNFWNELEFDGLVSTLKAHYNINDAQLKFMMHELEIVLLNLKIETDLQSEGIVKKTPAENKYIPK